jgi:ABC-type amino acid transport substrate-binding protein
MFSRGALAVVLSMASLLASSGPGNASETIKQIKGRGSLQVCLAETAPMAVRNPATGQWSGYNVQMAEDLARELAVKLEIVDQAYATIIPALMGGKCEIIMAPLLVNAQRAQVVAFTDYYSSSGNQVVVRQDAPFNTWEDLNNDKVTFAVAAGTQDEAQAKKLFPNAKIRPVISENTYAFFLEIAAGRAEAAFPDRNSARLFTQKNPQMKLKVLQPDRVSNPAGRAYAVRPDDWHFVNFLNNWLFLAKDRYAQD